MKRLLRYYRRYRGLEESDRVGVAEDGRSRKLRRVSWDRGNCFVEDDGGDEGSVGEVDLRKGIVEAWAPRKGGR